MKTRAALSLGLSTAKAMESLRSVLAPDNVGIPRGTRLSMEVMESTLVFDVESASASTALSTLLALLRDITLFQEVWLLSHGHGGGVRRVGKR